MAEISKQTSYSNFCSSRLISIILASFPSILKKPLTYNFQVEVIRGCYVSSAIEEVIIEGGDFGISIRP